MGQAQSDRPRARHGYDAGLIGLWVGSVCFSVQAWRSRFPIGEGLAHQQFAHDLVWHITLLHEAGRLTADFLQLAVGSLGKSLELDAEFRAMVVDALKCLEARAAGLAPPPTAPVALAAEPH